LWVNKVEMGFPIPSVLVPEAVHRVCLFQGSLNPLLWLEVVAAPAVNKVHFTTETMAEQPPTEGKHILEGLLAEEQTEVEAQAVLDTNTAVQPVADGADLEPVQSLRPRTAKELHWGLWVVRLGLTVAPVVLEVAVVQTSAAAAAADIAVGLEETK
jgi:hypothetical protein